MNKKLTNILRTNVTLYFICLVLFALAAIPFDVRLAIGEGAAAVLLLIIARRRSRSVQQSMRQYMDRFTGGMDSARSSNMLFAPLPMMVFDMDTQAVVWCNDGFLALTEQKEGVFDAHLNAVVPTFSVRWLMEGKNECPEHVVWNHRIYRVYGGLTRPTPDTPATMATTYWMDVTDSEQLRQTLQMTRPVVAILMVDNYEDLMKACPESKRSAVLAQLEEKLDQWSAGADGLMLHYDRDRYLFVFEERSYSDYAQHRFAVLDTVREVAAGGVAATLSIGVGRDADSFDALFKNASLALEMALSRGGDQAVVKDRLNFQFYGGRAKSTEKRTKVKSRVMASALNELMADASEIYIMGHSFADMDAVGASGEVGIMQLNPGPGSSYHAEIQAATGLDPTTASGNIAGGCYKLGLYLAKYGSVEKAAMAYNMGEGGARSAWDSGITSTDYSKAVKEAMETWECTVNAWGGV